MRYEDTKMVRIPRLESAPNESRLDPEIQDYMSNIEAKVNKNKQKERRLADDKRQQSTRNV